MMNQDQKYPSHTSHVNEIIELAKGRKIRELQSLIDRHISIDERTVAHKINIINEQNVDCTLLLTPAGILAMNGDFESANFLKDYCFANVDFIAYGAACGGHFKYAKVLQTDDHANIDYIAEGAAFNGNESYLNELLMENKGIKPGRIARGLANGGHREKAESMKAEYKSNNIAYCIASGAGRSGIRDYANDLLSETKEYVDWIAEGAALCGHTKYIEETLRPLGADLTKIANSAAYGGHFDYVDSISHDLYQIESYSMFSLSFYAAEGGHFAYALDKDYEGDGISGRFCAAIKGGHISNAENLFYIYDGWLGLHNFGNKIEEFIKNDEKRTLLLLAQAKTEKFRKRLFENLAKDSVKDHFKDTRLLEKAKAIIGHMTTYNISISQALSLLQKGDDLCLMSTQEVDDDIRIEPGKIYIRKLNKNILEYAVFCSDDKKIKRSFISKDQLPELSSVLAAKKFDKSEVKKCRGFLDKILQITSKKGHTPQKESSLKALVDFEIEFAFPRELNIIIFLYVFELSPLTQKFLGDKICGLIGSNLYQNFSVVRNLKKIDDQHYSKLGLFNDNRSIKGEFITEAENIITPLPANSRPHFFQSCSKSKTACYHRILFPLTSNTSKKFQELAKATYK